MQLCALFRLVFTTTTLQKSLILLHRVSHRLIMQKARGHAYQAKLGLALPQLVGHYGFRFYFTSLPGNFSPFLHSTFSLSVARSYLALGDGPPRFPQVWLSRGTRE